MDRLEQINDILKNRNMRYLISLHYADDEAVAEIIDCYNQYSRVRIYGTYSHASDLLRCTYMVTGYKANTDTRFAPMKYNNIHDAMSINLWRGSVWALLENGKRKKLRTVYN